MATKKSDGSEPTRLVHANGNTVVVTAEKAERLIAGGLFTEAKSSTTKPDSSK